MPKLRISIVEFLNTAPLVWGFTDGPLRGRYDLSFTVPSLCAEALRAGASRHGHHSCHRIPAHGRSGGAAGNGGGGARAKCAASWCWRKSLSSRRRIALDTNSRSSVALVRLLCEGFWHIAPEFMDMPPDPAAMLAEADAALVIGDPALRVRLKVDALARKSPRRRGAAAAIDEASSLCPASTRFSSTTWPSSGAR